MGMMAYRCEILIFLLAMSHLLRTAQSLNTACYHKLGGVQHASPNSGPCGIVSPNSPFYSCCAIDDQCLDNGICHSTHNAPVGSNTTGYYVGGCNDASLADSACNTGCNQLTYEDVVFNRTAQEWFCCGAVETKIKCDDPTTATVSAKALASIATTYVVPNQVATTTTSSTSAATTTTSAPTATKTGKVGKKSGSSTPVGAIVGGVVGGVVLITILVGGWFFWRRRNTRTSKTGKKNGTVALPSEKGFLNGHVEKAAEAERVELQTHEHPVELSAQSPQVRHNRASGLSELPT